MIQALPMDFIMDARHALLKTVFAVRCFFRPRVNAGRGCCGLVWIALVFAHAICNASTIAQDEFFDRPIFYQETQPHDAVARLIDDINSGNVQLEWDPQTGWLRSIVGALDISAASQVLVFSKTSLQVKYISPENPRAIYFNDQVYVGYVPGGELIELSAVDDQLGAVFYSIQQMRDKPVISRDRNQCLSCHATSKTHDVPGYLIRSVFPRRDGQPEYSLGTTTVDHTTPFSDRFGGWYLTGQHGKLRHRGNVFVTSGENEPLHADDGANQNELPARFSIDHYLNSKSDIVALMVLEHQTQAHNLITAANFETRQALDYQAIMNEALDREPDFVSDSTIRRIDKAAEALCDYLLFKNEFLLTSPVQGDEHFERQFLKLDEQDSHAHSLRQFDLKTRLLHYPVSYLVESTSFDALPDQVRTLTLGKMADRLHRLAKLENLEPDEQKGLRQEFPQYSPELAEEVLAALRERKPEFAAVESTRPGGRVNEPTPKVLTPSD